jgi:hypothetical protein
VKQIRIIVPYLFLGFFLINPFLLFWLAPHTNSIYISTSYQEILPDDGSLDQNFVNFSQIEKEHQDMNKLVTDWQEFDRDQNKIFDTLDVAFLNQSIDSFRLLININRSASIFDRIISLIENESYQIYSKLSFDNSYYIAGNWSRSAIQRLLRNPLLMSELFYLKIDEEAQSTMLESLNQMQLNNPEFYALENLGDPTMRLAILDRGIDPTHPVFGGKNIYWKDFTQNNNITPVDPTGHGTACASIAVGSPYSATDIQGRTIISNSFNANWGTNFSTEKTYLYYVGAVNVTRPEQIEYHFNYTKPSNSGININAITILDKYGLSIINQSVSGPNSETLLSYSVPSNNLGLYRFGYLFTYIPGNVNTQHSIQCNIHVPYSVWNQTNPGGNGYNTYQFRGVAPNVQIALLRVAFESEILNAMNWLLQNAKSYNITTVSISLGIQSAAIIDMTNNLVNSGLVVVAAAGNDGPGSNYAGSVKSAPGSAALAISVGALTRDNSVASYSSQGGYFSSQGVSKPDIIAPGGEFTDRYDMNTPLIVADSNDGEFLSESYNQITLVLSTSSFPERIQNDTRFMVGTSFSAPFVAGVILLLMNQMGGMKNWTYTKDQVLFLKNLLLLSASETAPNLRIYESAVNSPTLDRGGKDPHEGFGKINPLVALSLLNSTLLIPFNRSFSLRSANSSLSAYYFNYNEPVVQGFSVKLTSSNLHHLSLTCSPTLDADIYVYEIFSDLKGEPILLKKSTNSSLGARESIDNLYSLVDKDVFILVKAIIGYGNVELTFTQNKDDSPPHTAIISSAQSNKYSKGSILFSLFAEDSQTDVVSAELLISLLDHNGNSKGILNQSVIRFSYVSEYAWDTRLHNDGWYSICFRFFDAANNSLVSNSIIIGIDNTAPGPLIISRPIAFQEIRSNLYVEFSVQDSSSGLMTLEFMENKDRILFYSIDYSNINQTNLFYVENRTITDHINYEIDSSWNGIRYLQIKCQDRAGNIGYSLSVAIDIQIGLIDLSLLSFSVGLVVPSLYIVNKVAKYLLTHYDFFEIGDRFFHLPRIIQEKINKNEMKSTKISTRSNEK